MFIRLLAVLISNILCCFSVLVCCRSLVQFEAKRGEIKQRQNFGPCKCNRTHDLRSSTATQTRVPHVALTNPMLHRFNTCTVGILRQLSTIDRILCDRAQCGRTQCPRSNVHGANTALRSNAKQTIECKRNYDRSQHLRSSASLTWRHT